MLLLVGGAMVAVGWLLASIPLWGVAPSRLYPV